MGVVGAAAWQAPRAQGRLTARLLTAVGLALLGPTVLGFLGAAGPLRALGAGVGLGLIGAAAAAAGRAVASGPASAVARRAAPPPLPPAIPSPTALAAGLILAAAATALGPHLAAVFGGLTFAAWAGYFAFHRAGARPVPVAPALTLLLLPAYWLLAAVAGTVGLGISDLQQVPLSPAAELLVIPALLAAAWAVSGLWPLQRQLPGALLAPLGALLLARAALPLSADDLGYWRPVTVPVVMLGLWNAAAYARWSLVLAAAGLLAVAAGPTPGRAAAALLGLGLGLELCASAREHPRLVSLLRPASWPVATWAGLQVLESSLHGEVVYTSLGALGLALVVAAGVTGAAAAPSAAR
jgi:hypothetical protein